MKSYELMSVDDVLNALGLAGVLAYFLVPTMLCITVVYAIRRIKFRIGLNRKKIKAQEDNAEKLKNAKVGAELPNIDSVETKDYKKYDKLSLEFDEKGRVKE